MLYFKDIPVSRRVLDQNMSFKKKHLLYLKSKLAKSETVGLDLWQGVRCYTQNLLSSEV